MAANGNLDGAKSSCKAKVPTLPVSTFYLIFGVRLGGHAVPISVSPCVLDAGCTWCVMGAISLRRLCLRTAFCHGGRQEAEGPLGKTCGTHELASCAGFTRTSCYKQVFTGYSE